MKIFSNRNFLRVWSSQTLSVVTINLIVYLLLVRVYEDTGSSVASSFVWVAYGLPAIIIGPIAAAYVDVLNKRKILMTANFVQATSIAIFAVFYSKFFFLAYAVVAIYSTFNQFYDPAEAATLPVVVKRKMLARANSLFFITQQAGAFIGFIIAGFFNELIGFGSTVFIGAVLLFAAFTSVSFLPDLKGDEIKGSWGEQLEEFLGKMKEGYKFIAHEKLVSYPFVLLIFLQVIVTVLLVNLPAIGPSLVKTSSSLVTIIVIVPAAIGAGIATIGITKSIERGVRKIRIIENSLATLSLSFMITVLVAPMLPFWAGRLTLIFSFFLVGLSFVGALIPTLTFLQIRTPKRLMGRVFGNYWFLTTAITLLPIIFAATIVDLFGVNSMLFIMGITVGIMFVYSKMRLHKIFVNFKR